ncbi:MAG: molybdate ABC transporter substrate-binding protein [Deltaproteobacteria bacterium]|nr:molybdate ABC transporter substrate-binding protein [Deltaproteobacteria bacterium]
MKRTSIKLQAFVFIFSLFFIPQVASTAKAASKSKKITIAVASNAEGPLREIARAFEAKTKTSVTVVTGSTGKLYAQITLGAPFDIFFSADDIRPRLLTEKNLAKKETLFTYASGTLALWTPEVSSLDISKGDLTSLKGSTIRRVAIANPELAPYGHATVEALKASGVYSNIKSRVIYGENVAQAFGFARSGNAEVAIVSLSILFNEKGKITPVSKDLYSPILQQAVITNRAPTEALEFIEFLRSDAGDKIFKKYGYRTLH